MKVIPTLLAVAVAASSLHAGAPTAQDLEFFESKVRPVLAENCFKCHSAKVKVKGGLRLDARDLVLKGGDTGPALVPGHPDKSQLLRAIGYEDPELRMPPRGKLSAEIIANLTEWVRRGAPWPEDKVIARKSGEAFDLKVRSGHWSLQPLKSPPMPEAKAWARNGIDRFILAALENKKLKPAAPADKHTLLRRVTFDLTGLPPIPAEIDAFVKDDAADAYARVVDRLLASPRYAERWARHWLDLARYAETMGHEFDFEIPDAWHYRDYLIRALDADVPFNRFVMEHVAGDLLPDPRRDPTLKTNESILGTMFWLLGEAKHSPVDSRADQADRIDNQIDVFGKTFLGMTIACARCHDHKFDAISTKDYYALAGYVQSSRPDRAILDDPAPRLAILEKEHGVLDRLRRLAAKQAAEQLRLPGSPHATVLLEELLKDPSLQPKKPAAAAPKRFMLSDEEYQKRRQIVVDQLEAQKRGHELAMKNAVLFADARLGRFDDWIASGEAFAFPPQAAPLVFDFTRPIGVSKLLLASKASSQGLRDEAPGALRSPTFTITKKKIHTKIAGKNARVNLILDGLQLIRDPIYGRLTFVVNTPAVPVVVPKSLKIDPKNPLVSIETRDLQWQTLDVSMWIGNRAYIEVLDEGTGEVTLDQVVFSDDGPPPPAPNRLLLDLLKREVKTWDRLEAAYHDLVKESLDLWETGRLTSSPDSLERTQIINSLLRTGLAEPALLKSWEDFPNRKSWEEGINTLKDRAPLPSPRRAMTLCDGTPLNEHVFIRGNSRNPGKETPRRFLEVFGGASPGPEEKGSGRLELARHMVDPERTPILPRVIVNRLWKHHFGEGIVRSVDDFGVLGQPPSHPELLDWLATEFIKEGWSLKKMHRLMVLSATYQMSSSADKETEAADPDNQLWHRMPVRRLEAEAIRDALLAVSGRLRDERFGPPVPPNLTAHMLGRGRPSGSGPLDGNGRRGIYLGVRRNFLNPMFLAFDFPTPFSTIGKRTVSNVPAQALTMLNNPLVLQQAEAWAKELLANPGVDRLARIETMLLRALGRPPQASETALAVQFLQDQDRNLGRPDDPRAWTELCHVVFNLKEFIFVP